MFCLDRLHSGLEVCARPIHTHPFNGPMSGTTQVSRYQEGKTNLDFTGARDSEWQWHQLGHMQVCPSLQTDNHANTSPLRFYTGRMPFLPPNQQRQSTEGLYGTKVCRYNWRSAGSLGWPFPVLKHKYNFQITYTEAILSNSVVKLLWFEITKMLIVKVKVKFSHTRYRALGPELIPVYRQSARR